MDGGRLGITDAEREAVIASLRRRAALGHLDDAELTSRISRARTAMTRAGLDGLLMDLPPDPDGAPPSALDPAAPPWADLDTGARDPGPPSAAVAPAAAPPPTTTGPTTTGPTSPTAPPPPAGYPLHRGQVGRAGELPTGIRASDVVPMLVVLAVVAAFGIAILVVVGRSGGTDAGPPTISDEGSTYSVPGEVDRPTTASSAATSTTTTAPAPAETTPPPETPDRQELVVGVDITAGRYMQPDGVACFWEVQDSAGEPFAFGASDRPVLDVRDGEVVVLDFCGALVPYAPAAAPATSVGSGDWLVGEDLVAGTYRPSAAQDFCLWERADGFRHDFDEIVEWDDTARDVTVQDGERFTSDGCGTWTRV